MKKIYIILFLALFILMPTYSFADEIEVTGSAVRIRKVPNTDSKDSIIKTVDAGVKYTLKSVTLVSDTGTNGNNCEAGWYSIVLDGYESAYICSTYTRKVTTTEIVISEEAKTECEKSLSAAGFPETYWDSLCKLKVAHPTWEFKAVNTGLDFKVVVENESKCGNSAITKSSDASYQDTSCTRNPDSGYSWASQTAVAYYMNPLNWLTEKYIFMFESNYYNENIGTDNYTKIANTFISSYITNGLTNLDSIISTEGKNNNVSPSMISARIVQELGSSGLATSNTYKGQLLSCISGKYTTRWGIYANDGHSLDNYYNFFNRNVYDGSNGDAAYVAVRGAYKYGWGGTGDLQTDLGLAIGGGASWLKKDYLDEGQNTIYFQKFNVNPTTGSGLYTHQYMTNLLAPSSESSNLYTKYSKANLLENSFVFYIPVYNNMDTKIENTTDAGSGEETENKSDGIDVETIITSSGYKINGTTLSGIEPGTTLEDFKNKINSLGGTVTSAGDKFGTNTVVSISNGTTEKQYTILIRGDVSGDGSINSLDLLQIQKYILKQITFTGVQGSAADATNDGSVNSQDLLRIQKKILGQGSIEQ